MQAREIQPHELAMAFQECFTTPAGQIVLAYLVTKFGRTTGTTFDENPVRMAYNEGQRTVLVDIGKKMATQPEDLDMPSTGKTERTDDNDDT